MHLLFSRIRSWFSQWLQGPRVFFLAAVVLSLIGCGILIDTVIRSRSLPPASPSLTIAEIQTDVELTEAALPVSLPTDTPLFQFTPVVTATPAFPPSSTATITSTSYPPTVTSNTCNASIYISDVTIPDGTLMVYGTNFVKTWMFQNTGTCIWDPNFELIYVSGDRMGGTATRINKGVAPGQQAQVSIALTAPAVAGTYTGYWRLANSQGGGFGGVVFVKIVAVSALPSSTPTQTATCTPSPTPTGSATATSSPSGGATNTLTPSNPMTLTVAPTPTPSPTVTPTQTGS